MNKTISRDMRLLTYAGILPFFACALGQILHDPRIAIPFTQIAIEYGAVIIAFLCGIHWAVYLFFHAQSSRIVLLASNIIALAAFASLHVPVMWATLCIQIICFVAILGIDRYLQKINVLPSWFFALRVQASFCVIACLAVLGCYA